MDSHQCICNGPGLGGELLRFLRWTSFVPFEEAHEACAPDRRGAFLRDHWLDGRALAELGGLRRQFRRLLEDAGLLAPDAPAKPLRDSLALVRGLLVAGLHPHVAVRDVDTGGLRCRGGAKWWCHPQSVNFEFLGKGVERKARYVVWNARLQTSKPSGGPRGNRSAGRPLGATAVTPR